MNILTMLSLTTATEHRPMSMFSSSILERVCDAVAETMDRRTAHVFRQCFTNTLETTIQPMGDGTAFVVTGDIPAMWLRDSAAQLAPYLHFLDQDRMLADTVAAVSRRQLAYLLLDTYANAFNRSADATGHSSDLTDLSPWVWERKYEVDSLCYPIQLAYDLWRITGRTDHLYGFTAAARNVVQTIRTEQDHEARSAYRFQRLDAPISDTLERDGFGPLVAPTGLTWSGFRPSDDACRYGYNIPGNAFAAVELGHMSELAATVFGDRELAEEADALRAEIEAGIRRYGVVAIDGESRLGTGRDRPADGIFAYEVDGFGNAFLADDANVPSLLSLPLFGWCASDDPTYLATRDFILSDSNPYFHRGSAASGQGSPHTPENTIWPIALAVQGLTARDPEETRELVRTLTRTDAGTGLMHESFHKDDPTRFTRDWFSWANAMFCELVLDVAGLRTYTRHPASMIVES